MSATSSIFAFTQRPEFKTLLELECKELAGFSPVIKDNAEDFESLVGLCSDITVAIIDAPSDEKTYMRLLSALNAKGAEVKTVLILADDRKFSRFTYFGKNGIPELIAHVKTLIRPETVAETQYISIPVDSFIHFKMVPFDLYLKLGEGKFVRRIPAMEDIDETLIRALQAKGVEELYFERKHNRDFSLLLLNNMINKVETSYDSQAARAKAASEVFLTTKEIVRSVGLPSKVVQVCESVMENITAEVTRSKDKFSSYLVSMKSQTELSFQFRFVELTSFIATQMVDSLENAGPDKVKTIVFCSFFCDIALKEGEFLEIRSDALLAGLWPEDKETVSLHALKASEIVSKYKNAPAGADQIVKQHHGSPEGKGFPARCEDKILPMARCLMASQELAFALLKDPDKSPAVVVSEVVKRFEGTPLSPYLKFFESSCQEFLKAA